MPSTLKAKAANTNAPLYKKFHAYCTQLGMHTHLDTHAHTTTRKSKTPPHTHTRQNQKKSIATVRKISVKPTKPCHDAVQLTVQIAIIHDV